MPGAARIKAGCGAPRTRVRVVQLRGVERRTTPYDQYLSVGELCRCRTTPSIGEAAGETPDAGGRVV